MFSVEIRINGNLITHIYGYNVGQVTDSGAYQYDVDVYKPENRKFKQFNTTHMREDGIDILVAKILAEITNKDYGKSH